MVSGSLSDTERGEHHSVHSSFPTYTEQFYEVFPYYLAIGMTYDQFWNDDVELVKYYRKADEMRTERRNQELWLQGMYVYEAFCDASPLLHAFAKKGVKAHPYSDRPYSLTEKAKERAEEDKARANAEKGKKLMEAFMVAHNAKYKGKGKENEGGGSNG